MRILHTADWHLCDRLGRQDRTDDLRRAVERIAGYCKEEQVDLLLVAGDLFSELAGPDALRDAIGHLQEVFQGFLRDGGTILTLTGNHDKESFCQTLQHAMSLAAPFSGHAGELVQTGRLYLATGPTLLRLADRKACSQYQFILMPYPTPARYLLDEPAQKYQGLDEKNRHLMTAYTNKLHDLRASEAFDPNLQTVLSAHIAVRGSELHTLFRPTEQEEMVFSDADLPAEFAYSALGHIHKPQFLNGRLNVRYCGSIERLDLGESRDEKGVVLLDLTPEGLAAEPRVLPLDATPIYEVVVRSPQTDIPDLQKRYPNAGRDLVKLDLTYTAGVDNREEMLRQLEAIFPRWYDRTITESGALGPTLVIGEARAKSFDDTVRDYLTQELTNHPEAQRDAVLARAETLLREVQALIPQLIKLRGFLCYKDEQEVSFEGNSTLWMLSGLNGSGKSSIFDALTYALFGHHRGGGLHAHELINKDCDSLLVEFDFLLDSRKYRAKRTLRRKTAGGASGTQQLFWLKTAEDGGTSWLPIEGTGQKREFDAWIANNFGLNYDTFTSSVLLLQGKAEKLLDSKPEGRREVLASIVDLARYEQLHQKADEERKRLADKQKLLEHRLQSLPEVSEDELKAAHQQIVAADKDREEARADVERWQGLEFQAKEWAGLQTRLVQARQRWQQADKLLKGAAGIEQAMERLRDLRETLPLLPQLSNLRSIVHQAQVKIAELTKLRQKHHEKVIETDNTLKQTRTKRESRQHLLEKDERSQRDNGTRLIDCTTRMGKLLEYEQQEGEWKRVRDELEPLPADPVAVVREARERCEQLNSVAQTVKLLERFQSKRESLQLAMEREQTVSATHQRVLQQGQEAKAEFEKLKPQLDEVQQKARTATEEATTAKALLQQARAGLRELTDLGGAHLCRACGQPLTPKHLAEEKRRRNATVKECDKKARETHTALETARVAEQQVSEQHNVVEKKLQEAREAFVTGKKDLEQALSEAARLRTECVQAWEDLPEAHRLRVSKKVAADWLATSYPSDTDLREVRAEAGKLTAAKQSLLAAEKVQERWTTLKSQESAVSATLKRLQADLPADRAAVRREHTELQTKGASLHKSIEEHRAALKENDRDLDRLTKEREQTHQQWVETVGLLKQQEDVQIRAAENEATTLKQLPASWQAHTAKVGLTELSRWQQELHDLEASRAEERGKELQHARHNLEILQRDYQAQEQEQEKYPVEARQELPAIQDQLSAAKRRHRSSEDAFGKAKNRLSLLEHDVQQRRELEADKVQTDGDHATQKLLADLLGRDRLQLHLVRQAERQVVEHANAVLDRLSGGQLYLKLRGVADGEGGSGKRLELDAFNRSTGEQPMNVLFLSGSQKFRVAVSLALGIGQYASRQHRPIESVIIDEGFGCLDNEGRQGMIRELQKLREQMKCILLVSHQDDFAEAFTDGYDFKLEGGATKVTRFQR